MIFYYGKPKFSDWISTLSHEEIMEYKSKYKEYVGNELQKAYDVEWGY